MFRVEGGPLDEPTAGDRLSMADAVKGSIATSPALQAALARVRIAMADAEQARLLPNPVLNLVLRWGAGAPQVEVSLAQDLVAAMKIPNRASAADNRLRQSAADAVTEALDVVSEVQETYAAAQASDALIPVLERQAELLVKIAGIARHRLDAGEGVRSDVTTLDSQRVGLEVALADARLQSREQRLRLARLVGEPSGAAAWALDPWTPPTVDRAGEAEWVDAALARRPEVQAIAWELAALGDDEALTRFLPWDGAGLGIDAQKDPDWAVGPSIATPVPIFDMGQAAKARVAAQQAEARHRLTRAKREVVESVRSAHVALRAHLANLARVRQEFIPLEEQRRREAEDAYRAGQTDVTPLFLAEQGVSVAQAKAIEVERETTLARIRLERAVGGPGAAPALARGAPDAPRAADAPIARAAPDPRSALHATATLLRPSTASARP
ncbi:MAG: TolC family protein [Phycisphaerales bacterium]